MRPIQNIASTLLHISILATLFATQSWYKLPDAPAPFTSDYVTGFVIVIPVLLTIGLWVLTGFRGIQRVVQSKTNLLWFLTLIGFAGWAVLSQHWDFVSDERAGVAHNAGLQIVLVFTFALVVFCHPLKLRWVLGMLIVILLIQGVIGGLQVAYQSSISLHDFGEFRLRPMQSGVSVIQTGDLRWLRPYGLLPHPNIYAGLIVAGLFASAGFILNRRPQLQIGGGVFLIGGLWILLLTFSRGAWGSFGLGVLVSLFFVLRYFGIKRHFIVVALIAMIMGVVFLVMYRPLMASRVGASTESIEMRSVADRIVFNEIAFSAIELSPYIGIGAGNFPWYAAHYLHNYTDYDLRGDNVHMVALGIWSEYGLVGLALLGINILTALLGTTRNIWRYDHQREERIAILGIIIAYTAIGIFDHYTWTLMHTQIIWFAMMACGLAVILDAGNSGAVPTSDSRIDTNPDSIS